MATKPRWTERLRREIRIAGAVWIGAWQVYTFVALAENVRDLAYQVWARVISWRSLPVVNRRGVPTPIGTPNY